MASHALYEPCEPLAIRVAEGLKAKHGDGALTRAAGIRDDACAGGHIVRADLFVAVCAILLWRPAVTARWTKREQRAC